MNALARNFRIEDVEEDPSVADGATKECPDCDPDGYVRAKRASCKLCKGTGRAALGVVEVAKEIRASKKEVGAGAKGRGGSGKNTGKKGKKAEIAGDEDDDLYLEY